MASLLEPSATTSDIQIRVRDLTVVYDTPQGLIPAVNHVTMNIYRSKITGIIGESGSGKSTLAMGILNAVNRPGYIQGGSVELDGIGDLAQMRPNMLRKVRGREIGYVFQAAQNSLNPLRRVGHQVLDLGRSHRVADLRGLLHHAHDLLDRMGLDGARVLNSFQHELSGGMRQRVGMLFALILDAQTVILDEPTTALDMLTQASVLNIVRDIHAERNLTTVLITHDMGVVADMADHVIVMYGGTLVEEGPTEEVLGQPRHPYTKGLIQAMPRITGDLDAAKPLVGSPPDASIMMQPGCTFRARCPLRMPICDTVRPDYLAITDTYHVACHGVSAHD